MGAGGSASSAEEVMLPGPSARGAGDAPQLVRGPGSPGSCRLLGFTAVYVETRLGKDGRGVGGTVPVPVLLAFSLLSPPPLPRSLQCFKVTFPGQT